MARDNSKTRYMICGVPKNEVPPKGVPQKPFRWDDPLLLKRTPLQYPWIEDGSSESHELALLAEDGKSARYTLTPLEPGTVQEMKQALKIKDGTGGWTSVSFLALRKKDDKATGPNDFVLKLPTPSVLRDPRLKALSLESINAEVDALRRLPPEVRAPDLIPPQVGDLETTVGWIHKISVKLPGVDLPQEVSAAPRTFVPGITVSEWVAQRARAGKSGEYYISLVEWFEYAKSMALLLRRVHIERVAHGYLSPDNVIVDNATKTLANPHLINFENKFAYEAAAETPGVFRRPFDAPEKLFHQERGLIVAEVASRNADWFVAADIFSLGLHLAFVLLGKQDSIPSAFLGERDAVASNLGQRYRLVSDRQRKSNVLFKRQLLTFVENHPDAKNDFPKQVIATEILFSCLRIDPAHRLADMDQVLDTLDHFSIDLLGARPSRELKEPDELIKCWNLASTKIESETGAKAGGTVQRYMDWRLNRVVGELFEFFDEKPSDHIISIRGGRVRLIDAMLRLTAEIGTDWSCDAVTTPTFWSRDNMTIGRLTSKLILAAWRGASIRWRLILRERDINELKVVDTMRGLKYITDKLNNEKELTGKKCTWDWQWTALPDREYNAFVRQKKSFIDIYHGIPADPKNGFIIAPDYQSDGGVLTTLRLWTRQSQYRNLRAEWFAEVGEKDCEQGMHRLESYPQRSTYHVGL